MTSFQKFFGKAIAIGAALSMTAGLALAADGTVSADKIVGALKPKPLTRGLSLEQADPAAKAKEDRLVAEPSQPPHPVALARRAPGDRGYRLDQAEHRSRDSVRLQLGRDQQEFDARPCRSSARRSRIRTSRVRPSWSPVTPTRIGGDAFNQDLSERRADTIKRYLVDKYGITGSDLVTVGYGKTKLKDTANPADGPDQSPRPGRQHGHQDRVEVTAERWSPPAGVRQADFQANAVSDQPNVRQAAGSPQCLTSI